MISQKLPPFWTFFSVSTILCLLGWSGLVLLVFLVPPTIGPRWLFFFLLFLAVSGTAMPVAYFLNRRFPVDPAVDGGVIVREAMWTAAYFSVLAWLMEGNVLTSGLALVLGVGLLLVEFLLRIGERSAWSPAQARDGAEDEGDEPPDEDEDDQDA